MGTTDPKGHPQRAGGLPEVDGLGKPEAKPGPAYQRDPGTVRPDEVVLAA